MTRVKLIIILLHIHSSESAGAVGVQRLKGQSVREPLPLLLPFSSVEAAGVAVSGEVQLGPSTEARAAERHRNVGDQCGDVEGRMVEERQCEGKAGVEKQEQVSQERTHHGDAANCKTRK